MLVKVLLACEWKKETERNEAISLMQIWEPIDITQALSLLSGLFSLNDTFKYLRVVQDITPEIISAFMEVRTHALISLETNATD